MRGNNTATNELFSTITKGIENLSISSSETYREFAYAMLASKNAKQKNITLENNNEKT